MAKRRGGAAARWSAWSGGMGENIPPPISLRLAVGGIGPHHPLLRLKPGICERMTHAAPGRWHNCDAVRTRKRIDNRVSPQAPKKQPAVIGSAPWWQKHRPLPALVANS